jgi:CRISPR-associated protein Csb1
MINQYDQYLRTANWLEETNLPVAIVLRETLEPVEGADAIVFPPTFAKGDKAQHPYQIDELRKDRQEATAENFNTCDIDTVGSQANRMESIFARPPLSALVPPITILAGGKKAKLVEVGHRIADAVVRFSDHDEIVRNAIADLKERNDAASLAKLAPTSLLFGFWDSRDSGFKAGRILSSTIRATNVSVVSRSGQYKKTFDPKKLDLDPKLKLADIGLDDVPFPGNKKDAKAVVRINGEIVGAHGGVQINGEIIRRTQINLVGLRALETQTKEDTMKLRRYLLGLALLAGRCQTNYALRQGCHLVLKRDVPIECSLIYPNGERENFTWHLEDAYKFVQQAAEDFGVGEARQIVFDKTKANKAKPEESQS